MKKMNNQNIGENSNLNFQSNTNDGNQVPQSNMGMNFFNQAQPLNRTETTNFNEPVLNNLNSQQSLNQDIIIMQHNSTPTNDNFDL